MREEEKEEKEEMEFANAVLYSSHCDVFTMHTIQNPVSIKIGYDSNGIV